MTGESRTPTEEEQVCFYASISRVPGVHHLNRWHSAFSREGPCIGGYTQTPKHISVKVVLGTAEFLQQFYTTFINVVGTFASAIEDQC